MSSFRVLPTVPSLLSAKGQPFIHRDLSWLQFNERVMDEARPASGNPLLERVKFLAISAANLDEFFMIRFSGIGRSLRALRGKEDASPENRAKVERLTSLRDSILETVAKFGAKQVEALDLLVSELEPAGIFIVKQAADSTYTFSLGKQVFETQVLPKLAPPETFETTKLLQLENLKMAVIFPDGLWFRISRTLPTMYPVRDEKGQMYFFFLDDLLATFLGPLFGLKGLPGVVRLTRDADITVDIGDRDATSIPDVVRTGLGTREAGAAVRLSYMGHFAYGVLEQAASVLKIESGQILPAAGSLVLHGLWSVVKETPEELASAPGLRHPPLRSNLPKEFTENLSELFEGLKKDDFLLHHPYDSFDAFVGFIRAAAQDSQVTTIEQTIYRMDRQSPLIDELKAAAALKRVRVIIELRARFDEFNNLRLADDLRKAGVEVAFGFGKLKLHAKVTLVTRIENGVEVRYTHLSTGNYNAQTAKMYTDLAVLTSHKEIGEDARYFFDCAWNGKVPQSFKKLVTAPMKLHRRLLSHIEAETAAAKEGQPTRIVAKVNALVDEEVVQALYKASQSGVKVDLIVRGACSLIPGVRGLSENIRVISVVDRFLEHSRIYYFESEKAMYLSSADWMPRNFFSRLEIAFPVLDQRIYSYIKDFVIPIYMSDTLKARELTHQGTWKRRTGKLGSPKVRSQFVFEKLALGEYDGTPLNA